MSILRNNVGIKVSGRVALFAMTQGVFLVYFLSTYFIFLI